MGTQGALDRVILVLRECIRNAPAVLLVLPDFWRCQLPGFSSVSGDLSPWFTPWVTASCFLAGNMEADQKLTTFSSLLLFCVFLSLLFS